MRNALNFLWLVIVIVGGLSSLKDSWSKSQKKGTKKHLNQPSATVAYDNSEGELPTDKALLNRQKWHQQYQEISENIETDFGEELIGETIGIEQSFQVERTSTEEVTSIDNQLGDLLTERKSKITTRSSKARNLRQAIVYHEILSKPKGLR